MKHVKTLSLLLALCMIFSLAMPVSAFADEDTAPVEEPVVEVPAEEVPVDEPPVEEAPAQDAPSLDTPVEDTSAEDTSTEDPSADGETAGSEEPSGDESAENKEDIVVDVEEVAPVYDAITMGTKPADGTTTGNPFTQGTGGSNSFRIPALVTLNDGTLVAAADARWNTTFDGGGLDTIVSYSTDNGTNWNYTFANYLGDNGNIYNGSGSTAFIDPALATDGSTVYMLCDLYPYGVALNGSGNTAPDTAVGFNSDGKLLLSTDGSNYNCYLDGTVIKDSSGNEVSGYTVDAYFNITGTDGTSTNLFFSDSPFKVVRTGYLYLTKSTDSGASWSAPTLIPNVKTSSEQVCLVGPGRGLVTDDKIIFPVYSYNGSSSSQQMGFIYSSDSGANWTRSANFTGDSWSSEAAVVELADGTLRFFYRNGNSTLRYVDYSWTNKSWGSAVNTGIATNSNTQISAISYSKTVDGQQVILVSCPTGSNSSGSNNSSANARLNGKIFVGYVNSDNTMSWQSDKAISVTSNDSQFMYSCLTELSDGKVAILYENQESKWGTGDDCYYTMDFQTYDLDLTFDSGNSGEGAENNDPVTVTDNASSVSATAKGLTSVSAVKKDVADTYTGYTAAVTYSITLNDGAYTDSAEIKIPYDSAFDGCNNFIGSVSSESSIDPFPVKLTDGYFVGTVPHFSDVTISGRTVTQEENVTLVVGETSKTYTEAGNYSGNYTAPNASIATIEIKGQDGQEGGVEYKPASVTCNDLISSDTKNWTAASGYYYTPDGVNYYPVYAKRSSDTKGSWWTYTEYTYTWGYKNGDSEPTVIGTQVEGSRTSDGTQETPNIAVYTQSATAAIPASTTFSFTGVSAGTTIAVVGSTQYNITVTRKTETVALTVGNTKVYTDASTKVSVSDNSVVSATLSNGSLSIQGLKDGTATVTTDTTIYKVSVSDGTPISIKENETTTISVTLEDDQTVEWSSADSSYVGVAGKYDTTAGAYTNEAILAGQNVTSSPVTVTGTVYNADGTVAGVHKWLVTVTEGDADTNASSKGIYFNVSTIEHCTVYYSINGGELIPVNGTGVTTGNWTENGTYKGHFNIMFFAAPDEGYALTYMSISGSADQYYTLSNGNPDGTGSDAWPFVNANQSTIPSSSSDSAWKTINGSLHGFRWALLEGNMTIDQMKVLFSNAIALGCDGATTITKNANEGMGSASSPKVCKFVAQKLPTVKKTITSITHNGTENTYTEGMKVEIGDTINYSVVVTRYATNATYGTITYDNEKLTDDLTGNSGISNPDMGTSTTSDKTYPYTTSLTLTMANFADVVKNGKITNTADFSYSYSSQYSAGTLETEASAVAEITVVVPEYVIDFGLPVEINLDSTILGGVTISSGTASYGTITPNGASFTYTPNKVLQGVDYVILTLNDGQTYGVNIYPATTVYYEEGFAVSGGNTGTRTQAAQVAGSSSDVYGYDAAYNGSVGPSNGGDATLTGSVSFNFTGTGVDIYTNNTPDTGRLMVRITDASGSLVKLAQVSTAMQTRDNATDATAGQAVSGFNVPVFSVDNLTRGTYTVTLTVLSGDVYLDGFRVYNTLDPSTSIYVSDLEDNPDFVELRDKVFASASINTTDAQYAGQIARNTMSQIYATGSSSEVSVTAVILNNDKEYTDEQLKDLLDNGPKNEIYLQPGQALTFKITTAREVQIGLKALDKATTYTITGKNGDQTLNSSTDMFYTVLNKGTSGEQTITITNKGAGILAVTKLKVCDDPNFSFVELTEEDLIPALVSLGYELEPEEPEVKTADAVLTVEVNGETVTLTKTGNVGESATFTAAEIEEAAQTLVPEGYELKDQAADVTVEYGKSSTVSLSVEEIPTEPEEPEQPEQPEESEEPEQPTEPEQPEKPVSPIGALIRMIGKIIGSLKGFFR